MAMTDDDKEALITFYKEHPMLWNLLSWKIIEIVT